MKGVSLSYQFKFLVVFVISLVAHSTPSVAQYSPQPYNQQTSTDYPPPPAAAPYNAPTNHQTNLPPYNQNYRPAEILESGRQFFGDAAGGLATAVEKIFASYGTPNGYILGEEGSAAFMAGLTYGEGKLYMKGIAQRKVYWQGPSLGLDIGGQGSRLMVLVYNLDDVKDLWGRYGGVSGSAYLIAGVGFNVLRRNDVFLVPIRTGVGARLGINMNYWKLTSYPTWNPF